MAFVSDTADDASTRATRLAEGPGAADCTEAPSLESLMSPCADFGFSCRTTIQQNGNTPREVRSFLEYAQDFIPGRGGNSVAIRKVTRRSGKWHVSKEPTTFCTAHCLHVTPLSELKRSNTLIAHFDKVAAMKEERTKSSSLTVRGWAAKDAAHVERLAKLLHISAEEYVRKKEGRRSRIPVEASRKSDTIVTGRRPSSSNKGTPLSGPGLRQGGLTTAQKIRRASGENASSVKRESGSSGPKKSGGKFSAMAELTQSLIGQPDSHREPLRQTKRERMQSRKRQKQVADLSGVSQGTKKRAEPEAPKRSVFNLPSSAAEALPSPSPVKRQRTGIAGKTVRNHPRTPPAIVPASPPTSSGAERASQVVRPGQVATQNGVENLGNTCYLGAALQALLHNDSFVADLRVAVDSVKARKASAPDFARALVGLVESRESENGSLNPELLWKALTAHFNTFEDGNQHDAQEFITQGFVILKREIGNNLFKCPVSRNFSTVLTATLVCPKCGVHTEPRQELMHDIKLDIPVPSSPKAAQPTESVGLGNLLNSFFQAENVDFRCENPKCCASEAVRQVSIALAPRVLSLHLSRVRPEKDALGRFSMRKVNDSVEIPETIDLTDFVTSKSMGPSLFDVDLSKCSGPKPNRALGMSVPGRARMKAPSPATNRKDDSLESANTCAETTPRDASPISEIVSPPREGVSDESMSLSTKGAAVPLSAVAQVTPRRRLFTVHEETPGKVDGPDEILDRGAGPLLAHDSELVEDIDTHGFEQTQRAPVERKSEREASLIRKLAAQFGVSSQAAQAALEAVNFDETRASGVLIDSRTSTLAIAEDPGTLTQGECHGDGIFSDVLGLVEQMLNQGFSSQTTTVYDLYAIIRHNSMVAEEGHYVCDVRQADGSWVTYDDTLVRPCGTRPYDSDDRKREGYMFFYKLR